MNTLKGTVRAAYHKSGERAATHLMLDDELPQGDGWKRIIQEILHFKKDGARLKITIEEMNDVTQEDT